ncbi:hypothetical protein M7I_6888 [Glarea lozoyensis 74030]|uniref:Uncharacterized protein n=1 Tax=Glarea lozoyensis (strain ATCC 74030 / MF5533) TaxID=1104152 RepID=H0EVT2_GLAL7|nr:hypothetical protein M7I_6888 [Glarea lozoyensis 74030]
MLILAREQELGGTRRRAEERRDSAFGTASTNCDQLLLRVVEASAAHMNA